MKKFSLLVVIASALIWGACENDSPVVPDYTEETTKALQEDTKGIEFKLPLKQRKFIEELNAVFYFDSIISDSRCPIGVVCVWQGEVEISLIIYPRNGEAIALAIKNTDRGQIVTLGRRRYLVRLLDVKPYPGEITSDRMKYAVIQVTNLISI